jgi:hypothetical protein
LRVIRLKDTDYTGDCAPRWLLLVCLLVLLMTQTPAVYLPQLWAFWRPVVIVVNNAIVLDLIQKNQMQA